MSEISFSPYGPRKVKPITDRQHTLISKMERRGCPKFKGGTRLEAANYIENNFEQYKHAPTERQLSFIHQMEGVGCPQFEGKTFDEAGEYINDNREFFKEQKKFMQ